MNLLDGNQDHCSHNHCQHNCVINGVFLGLAVVKGGKKFHEAMSHKLRYKTALPFLEIVFLYNWSLVIYKFGNAIFRGR
jgi:hypothetical protein